MVSQGAYAVSLDGARVREARVRLELSQAAFADAINDVLDRSGVAGRCTKRLVQKWEAGDHRVPAPRYQKALAQLTGSSFKSLCQTEAGGVAPLSGQLQQVMSELAGLMRRLDRIAAEVDVIEL